MMIQEVYSPRYLNYSLFHYSPNGAVHLSSVLLGRFDIRFKIVYIRNVFYQRRCMVSLRNNYHCGSTLFDMFLSYHLKQSCWVLLFSRGWKIFRVKYHVTLRRQYNITTIKKSFSVYFSSKCSPEQ